MIIGNGPNEFTCAIEYDPDSRWIIRVGAYCHEEDAAEAFAEWWDAHSSEYPKRQTVLVRAGRHLDGPVEWVRFSVSAESVRQYCATPEVPA